MDNFKQINNFLTDSAFFYTIAIGLDSTYTYVSNNYNRNFDQSNETLLGKHFAVTLHPDDIAICEEAGLKCFNNPEHLVAATLRKHDGRGGFVVTQWEMQAFYNEHKEPQGIFCIGYNITEYVDTRTKLERAHSEIANKNDQLNEISFLQSHGVRKPLANIMGLAGILETIQLDKNHKSINEMMIASARELDSVIRKITDKAH